MFKISGFKRKNLKWWVQHQASIDLEPDFQRTGRVWKEPDKAFLIDTILNRFDIPKIYITDFTKQNIPALNLKRKSYVVIDGKQRLSAIFAFFRNLIRLPKKFRLESNPMLELGNLRYGDLEAHYPEVARRLKSYVLDVKVIETDDRKKIADVFLRLNKASKALNGAEIRNAMMGRAVEGIRTIGGHRFFQSKIRFSTDRSQEKNAAAKILLLEYEGGPAETKKKNLDKFVLDVGESGSGRFNGTLRRVNQHMAALHNVFNDQDRLLSTQGQIPLYYLFISRLRARDQVKSRAFLEAFEKRRNSNRNRSTVGGDRALDSFDLVSRSTNDKSSIQTRLNIMRNKFARWKKTGKI